MRKQLKEHIGNSIKGNVLFDEPMSPRTSFKIGGPAEAWVEPKDSSALAEIIRLSGEKKVPLVIIGAGSNILVKDRGIRGIAVSLSSIHFRTIDKFVNDEIRVSAGIRLQKLLRIARDNGLGGLEFMVGIPGTLGGAAIMNTGGRDKSISDLITKVELMDSSGRAFSLNRKDINFGYRFSGLDDYVVLGVYLRLQRKPQDLIDRDTSRHLRVKKSFQELELPSAGSIFKNPEGPAFPSARLIELSGLKGKRIGNAQVSTKHANFIVNLGGSRAQDVIRLIELVRKKVKKDHKVDLKLELRIVG